MSEDTALIDTTLKNIKLEFNIVKKQFTGAWVDNHFKTPYEFTREVYIEIAKKYEHTNGLKKFEL